MGILTRALRMFDVGSWRELRGADPMLPWGSSYIPTNGQAGIGAAGIPMNDDAALSISTVLSCVSILANDVATLPLSVYRATSDKSKKLINPQPPLIQNPWPEGTLQDWLTQVMVSLTLRGNFFGQVVDRDALGYPTIIMPLHPDNVMARRNQSTGRREYRVAGKIVSPDDMMHIPNILVPGSFIGLNPVEYMRGGWGIARAAELYGGAFFSNSANPSGVISIEEDLTDERALRLKNQWEMGHSGIQGAQKVGVLSGGAKWTTIMVAPDDAQFLQTRDFARVDIASFFQVPLHRLNIQDRTTNTGTDIESAEMLYVTGTLANYLNRIQTYLSNCLPRTQVVKFDLRHRLRGNTLARYQSYVLARNAGLLKVNEIRDWEDLPAVPGGDVLLQPMNMVPLGTDVTADKAPPNGSGFDNGGGPQGSSPPGGKPGQV